MTRPASKDENLTFARYASGATHKALPLGAPNRIENWLNQTRRGLLIDLMRAQRNFEHYRHDYDRQFAGIHGHALASVVAQSAIKMKVGNCFEHSAVAFSILKDMNTKNIDWVECLGKDHYFVMIGRDRDQILTSMVAINPEAVVCDAWDKDCYALADIKNFESRAAFAGGYNIIGSIA